MCYIRTMTADCSASAANQGLPNSDGGEKIAVRTVELTRDFKTVRAVDRVSFEVLQGTIFGFLGPNGAGKTTTIRLLLGLIQPTSGTATVMGVDPAKRGDRVREVTGALLEHSGVYERLSAQENLEFYARLAGLAPKERRDRIERLLRHFGLWDRRKDRAGLLSKGMKQKLGIARAILHAPPLVFLDEPTEGLDPEAAVAVREDISRLARESGASVFLTTHNLTEAERLCDSVGVIHSGRLLSYGSIELLREKYSNTVFEIHGTGIAPRAVDELVRHSQIATATIERDRLLISLNRGASLATVLTILKSIGVEVTDTREVTPRLEDVYLALVRAAGANEA